MIRFTLHLTHLEPFNEWLTQRGIAFRPGKGDWQVMQVETPKHGWQVIFRRADMLEHYSINAKLLPLVQSFIDSRK